MPPGKWVRALGSDIEAGATVLAAGERVGAAEIGILATVGAARVQVAWLRAGTGSGFGLGSGLGSGPRSAPHACRC